MDDSCNLCSSSVLHGHQPKHQVLNPCQLNAQMQEAPTSLSAWQAALPAPESLLRAACPPPASSHGVREAASGPINSAFVQWSAWQALAATGKHSAHIQLPAIVHGNQSDGGCPPFLRVVPQQDVCDCDDDEGLGCVTQPTQQPVDGAEQDVAPEGRNSGVALRALPCTASPLPAKGRRGRELEG